MLTDAELDELQGRYNNWSQYKAVIALPKLQTLISRARDANRLEAEIKELKNAIGVRNVLL